MSGQTAGIQSQFLEKVGLSSCPSKGPTLHSHMYYGHQRREPHVLYCKFSLRKHHFDKATMVDGKFST